MLSSGSSHKNDFLAQTKAAREERLLVASRNTSAIKIQGLVRGWLARTRIRKMVETEIAESFPDPAEATTLKPSVEIYKAARKFCTLLE